MDGLTATVPTDVVRSWRAQVWRPWLAAALGIVCFVNSLPNGFVYDDKEIVRDNPYIRTLSDVRAIWLSEWWSSRGARAPISDPQRDRLYRPLTVQSFALNYALDRPNADGTPRPFGFHLVNVLLHGAVCALVWVLARRLTGDATVAGVAACAFAVHPIHAEAVANVVGRAELLAALFLCAGLIVILPLRGSCGLRRMAFAAACFLAALFAKESAICYPFLALLVLGFARPGPLTATARPRVLHIGPAVMIVLPLLIYFPLRHSALEGHILRSGDPNALFNPLVDADASGRAIGALTIAGHYTRLMLCPWTLSSDYGRDVIVPKRLELLTAIGLCAGIFVIGLVVFIGRGPPALRSAALAAAMLAASYALISNTVLLSGVSLAERLFYVPSIFACLMAAGLMLHAWRVRLGGARPQPAGRVLNVLRTPATAAAVVVAVLALLAIRTIARNPDWRNDKTLALRDSATYPQDALLHAFVARSLMDDADAAASPPQKRRMLVQADRRLERSLRIVFRNPYGVHLRGRVRAGLLDYPAAIGLLKLAIRWHPHDAEMRAFLDRLNATYAGDPAHVETLGAELARFPDDSVLHQRLGETLLRLGRPEEALAALRRAIELDPDENEARRMCGEALAALGRIDEALAALRDALARDPGDWQIHLNLSALLSATSPADALRHAEEAYRLRPDEFAADSNVAEALAINGRVADAIGRYRRILDQLAPEDPSRAFVEQRIRELSAGK